MASAIMELYSNNNHFKDRASLEQAIGLEDMGNNSAEIIKAIRDVTPTTTPSKEDWLEYVDYKQEFCLKSNLANRVRALGLPSIPTIVPKNIAEVKDFCKANGTVIFKPVKGHDCLGFKEYHYRPMEQAEAVAELELDLSFTANQNNSENQKIVILQKFFPLDGKDSYHYSFKGWIDNGGDFSLCHSYSEEWSVDPDYDSSNYHRLTNQAMSNALAVEKTTYETDKAIDDEVIRQTQVFCKDAFDSVFMHGDAIVSGGKVYLIDMSCVNNFPTMVSFALEGKTKFLIFPITMPTDGDRKKQIALVSDFSGQYVFNDRVETSNKKFLYFLFTGASMKEIQANRERYTKAIFK